MPNFTFEESTKKRGGNGGNKVTLSLRCIVWKVVHEVNLISCKKG
jgi:hypothetical protein